MAVVYGLGLIQPGAPSDGLQTGAGPGGLLSGRFAAVLGLWAAIVCLGILLSRKVDARIVDWHRRLSQGASAADVPLSVQRQVLTRPVSLALASLGFWILAGLVFGGLLMGSVRVVLVIAGVAGVLSVGLALPLVDLAWRPIVPTFFPDGRISAAPVRRFSVLSRLLLSLLLVGLYPTGLLAVASLTGAAALVDAQEPERVLNSLIALNAVLVGVSVLTAVVTALAVTRCITDPLGELRHAMDRVAEGDLTARATVTTSDELGLVAEGFNNMVGGLRRGEVVRGLLDHYVSPAVARHAVESGAELGGRLTHCTVLFADMRDFTALAERLTPDDLIALLNRFMSAMVEAVVRHGGLVNKFGGDSLLAVFGTPLNPCEDHAAAAIRAARDMQAAISSAGQGASQSLGPGLQVGIGIATGPVIAGNIGGPGRIEYTVIGATVNLAARLQELTREAEADILVAADTYAAASTTMPLGAGRAIPLAVRGLSSPVNVVAL